jgi:hypothetical protein
MHDATEKEYHGRLFAYAREKGKLKNLYVDHAVLSRKWQHHRV